MPSTAFENERSSVPAKIGVRSQRGAVSVVAISGTLDAAESSVSEQVLEEVRGRSAERNDERDAGDADDPAGDDEGGVAQHDAERDQHDAERREGVEPGERRRDQSADGHDGDRGTEDAEEPTLIEQPRYPPPREPLERAHAPDDERQRLAGDGRAELAVPPALRQPDLV